MRRVRLSSSGGTRGPLVTRDYGGTSGVLAVDGRSSSAAGENGPILWRQSDEGRGKYNATVMPGKKKKALRKIVSQKTSAPHVGRERESRVPLCFTTFNKPFN